ncbi:MAG: class I SAM-dependent methyltransferase [Betaproteobacteria bacterium]|nr:class I SAM-dependent methyltransferase [Betaproteobacteria bacterium]
MEIWDKYYTWFYDTNVWKNMQYHGIRTLKLPSDMWNYQEIIFDRGITHVVETGTRHGGSALFFADTLAARTQGGFVITVDIDAASNMIRKHERIKFLIGDSSSPKTAAKIFSLLPEERGPVFLILDSDHARDHVLRELESLVPYLRSGDYLVVEDSSVNGHPVRHNFGPGPWEAIDEFTKRYPGTLRRDSGRERKFGATSCPNGYHEKI